MYNPKGNIIWIHVATCFKGHNITPRTFSQAKLKVFTKAKNHLPIIQFQLLIYSQFLFCSLYHVKEKCDSQLQVEN